MKERVWENTTPESFKGVSYQIKNGSVRIVLVKHINSDKWNVTCSAARVYNMELICSDIFVAQKTAILVAKRMATKILDEICGLEDKKEDVSIF